MVELSSRGPDSSCGVQGDVVQPQFQVQNCGHTLSRLAEIRHNTTKQTRFPTIRRKSRKSRKTIQVILA
jgi:hypothetical protein